jgi:hypothetical protein
MGSLSRAQRADEAQAERDYRTEIAHLTDPTGAPDPSWVPGDLVPGSLRVLATGLGEDQASLYAFRTERGRVCGRLHGGAGGCFETFPQDHGISEMVSFKSDGSLVIFGFAPDRVETVRATVDGYTVSAPVHDNAYFIELASTWPSLVVLDVVPPADGVSETIEIPLPGQPQAP